MAAASLAGKPRKVIPKILAVIHADGCTGCEACVEVCPVDCIYKVPGEEHPSLQTWCDIDLDRCIGCKHCASLSLGCDRYGRHDRCVLPRRTQGRSA